MLAFSPLPAFPTLAQLLSGSSTFVLALFFLSLRPLIFSGKPGRATPS
tara:strand:+ start:651 stop:794 length:144 start_codon:yes stop_codon:yes gene_type:complete